VALYIFHDFRFTETMFYSMTSRTKKIALIKFNSYGTHASVGAWADLEALQCRISMVELESGSLHHPVTL